MNTEELSTETSAQDTAPPDEESGVLVDTKLRIFDPITAEVFFEGRA